tara:strand:- start:52093 stop:52245 length:153 start_codon:yes stop_codon:yes gene_type:complete
MQLAEQLAGGLRVGTQPVQLPMSGAKRRIISHDYNADHGWLRSAILRRLE